MDPSHDDNDDACVLVADDSAVVRLTVARRLRAEGLHVVEAESATVAVRALAHAAARVACALLDLELGADDGSELAALLRSTRADLPIAFFSSAAPTATEANARAMGPVFAKPGELESAIAWVKRHAKR